MAGNSFGDIFRITTFGESHGLAIGCIIDGCPSLLELNEEDIQVEIDNYNKIVGLVDKYGWE